MQAEDGRRPVADRVAPVAAAVLTLWVALPFLRPDRWVSAFDTVTYSGPNLAVTHAATRALRLPQWNPEIFGGVTHLGNPQAAALDPLAWLTSPLPVHRAMAVMTVVRLAVLASGVWWLVRRRLGTSPAAAAVGTMAVVGSGLVMARSIQFEQIAVVSWVPWLLVGCDVAIARRRWSGVAWAALPLAAAALSGHPQQLYLALPLAGLWSVGRIVDAGAGWPAVGRLVLAAALGAGLAAPQLVPTLAAMSDSAMADTRALEETAAYMVGLRSMPLLLLGDPTVDDQPLASGTFEGLAFVGVAAAALAIVALLDRRRADRGTRVAFVVAAAFGLLCAAGPRLPVYRALYDALPGFDLARVPARWMLLPTIALALLAALGLDRLQRDGVDLRRGCTAAGLLATLVAAAAVLDGPSAAGLRWWGLVTVSLGAVLVGLPVRLPRRAAPRWVAVGVVALVLVELGWASSTSLARKHLTDRPFDEMASALVEPLVDEEGLVVAVAVERFGDMSHEVAALRPNAGAALGIASLDGYDGGVQVTHRWAAAVAALAGASLDPELTLKAQLADEVPPAVAARLGVRWLLVERAVRDPAVLAPGWKEVDADGMLTLLENPRWRGPATLYAETLPAPTTVDVLRGTPSEVAVVAADGPRLECRIACDAATAELHRDRPEHLAATFAPSAHPRLLVVDVQAADGWRAEVDGRAAPVVEANGLFIGVEVPPGAERVELRYTTPGLRLGLVLGALAAAVLAAGALVSRRRATSR